MGLGRFGHITVGRNELLAMLPLALVGALCGILYFYFAKGVKVITAPLEKHKVLLGIIGGLVLGGVGMLLPFTMFAGEHQMGEMMEIWQTLPIWLLFLTGIVKLLMIDQRDIYQIVLFSYILLSIYKMIPVYRHNTPSKTGLLFTALE